MSAQPPPVRYDPASWAANRSDVGWALLGTVWSSVFWGGAVVAWEDGSEGLSQFLMLLAGIASLVAVITLTQIGWRLANGKVEYAPPPVPTAPLASATAPGTPSVRIISEPTRRRSDAWIMVGLAVGIVLAVVVVGLVVVAARA